MSRLQDKLGPALKSWSVVKGSTRTRAGSASKSVAVGQWVFDSVADVVSSFEPNSKAIATGVANYADIPPTTQVSETLAHEFA